MCFIFFVKILTFIVSDKYTKLFFNIILILKRKRLMYCPGLWHGFCIVSVKVE